MLLDIVTLDTKPSILTQPALEVQFPLSEEDKNLIEQMKNTLLALKGVGLAAPQVGIGKKIIIYEISQDAAALRNNAEVVPLTILINASYKAAQDTKRSYDWEGCFSVTDLYGKPARFDKITYKAQTLEGEWIDGQAEGFTARVLQHEIDHTDGISIKNRLSVNDVQGLPKDMMEVRIKDFTPYQKSIFDGLSKKTTYSSVCSENSNILETSEKLKSVKK